MSDGLPTDPLPERVGCFVIEGVLGRGGMGTVYRARDPRLHRSVAVKVLSPAVRGDAQRTARLMREARAAAAVAHPNIATVFEVGVDERGDVYLALELVEGRSLRDVLRDGPVTLERFFLLACEMASGVARAHRAGLIHRDLKPENVMVDTEGHAKILDFGLAKDLTASRAPESAITQDGAMLGTPGYMAPEQVRGRADARADVFALGVTYFEMLAGRRPFGGDTPLAALLAVSEEEPRALPQEIPAELARVIRAMIARSPEDRPIHGGAVLEALWAAGGRPTPIPIPASSRPPAATSLAYAATLASSSSGQAVAAPPGARRAWLVLLVALGALLATATAVLALRGVLRGPSSATPVVATQRPVFRPLRAARDVPLTGWAAGTPVQAAFPRGPDAVLVLRGREVVQVSRRTGDESVIGRDVEGFFGVEGNRVLVRVHGGDLVWMENGRAGPPIAREVLAASLGTLGIAVLATNGIRVVDRWGRPAGDLLHRRVRAGALAWFPTRPCVAAILSEAHEIDLVVACSDGRSQLLQSDRRLMSATGGFGVLAPRDDRVLFVRSTRSAESGAMLFEQALSSDGPRGPARPVHEWPAASASALAMDGRSLLYVRSITHRDIYVVDVDAAHPTPRSLVAHDAADALGSVSSTAALLFHSLRGSSEDIYRTSLDGTQEVRLVATPESDEEYPVAWHDSVMFVRRPVPRSSELRPWWLVRRDPDGSETTLLEGGPTGDSFIGLPRVACAIAADVCVLAEFRDGQTVVSVFDPARSTDRRLLYRWTRTEPLRRPAISADGSHVVLVPNSGQTALRVAIATETVTEWPITRSDAVLQYAAISPRGDRLAVTTIGADGFGLAWLDERGDLHPIFAAGQTWWSDPFFTPDGRSLALTGMVFDDDAWSLELSEPSMRRP